MDATAPLPTVSTADTLRTVADVVVPLVARGVIIRRPAVVGLIERFDVDRRAIRRMQRLRDTYGPGPVRLRIPGRDVVLVLAPDDARRVLDETPDPFSTANWEKRAALSRFEPHGVLVSHGPAREDRRRFNEAVLDSDRPVHGMAEVLLAAVVRDATALAGAARQSGRLTWEAFLPVWHRMVRAVVLGEGARDDRALSEDLDRLRASANWSVLGRRRATVRDRFLRRVQHHLDRADEASLAQRIADVPTDTVTRARDQVPQWLFAYDSAARATLRTLALVIGHPTHLQAVREELSGVDLAAPHELPYLRACLLDAVRLYPTTPAILRDTTTETRWASGSAPAGSAVLVYAPWFHRNGRVLEADRFAPELWLEGGRVSALGHLGEGDWPFMPFSGGPAICPGRNLVQLTATTFLGVLLQSMDLRLDRPRLDPGRLPSALSPFGLAFAVS